MIRPQTTTATSQPRKTGTAKSKTSAGPPAAGASTKTFIGVPPGYTVPRQAPHGVTTADDWNQPKAPRYDAGWVNRPATWTPEQRADLQQKMVEAGLLKPGSFRKGSWDPASRDAYLELLGFANSSGMTATDALSQYKSLPPAEGEKRGPFVAELVNPEDIKQVARATSIGLLGRALNADELDSLASAYMQLQEQKQRQAYDLAGGDAAGRVIAPPSVETFTESRIRQERPADVESTAVNARADEFFALLGAFGDD